MVQQQIDFTVPKGVHTRRIPLAFSTQSVYREHVLFLYDAQQSRCFLGLDYILSVELQ